MKHLIPYFIFSLIIATTTINNAFSQTWTQKGDTISTSVVTMNADGTVYARNNSSFGSTDCIVEVMEWDGSQWSQKGNQIVYGDGSSGCAGNIELSSSGNTVGLLMTFFAPYPYDPSNPRGLILTYDWNGSSWVERSDSIKADASGGVQRIRNFKLSGDGESYIIGGNNTAKVYGWNGNSWVEKGNLFEGDFEDDLGHSLDISENGNTIIIGSPQTDPVGQISLHHGKTKIYEWNVNAWVQKGSTILGETALDYSGEDVGISADGSTVIIGAAVNSDAGNLAGHARIFNWTGGSWSQIGNDIDGEYAGDWSGSSVDINSDGSVVVIGALKNNEFGYLAGHVRVYYWNGSIWYQKGNDIDGAEEDEFGSYVEISHDGDIILASARGSSQYARILYFCNDPQITIEQMDSITLTVDYPDADSYQWINCDTGLDVVGETGPSFTAQNIGNYAVKISEGDCEYISNCLEIETVSTPYFKKETQNINIFPNPNNGLFTVQIPEQVYYQNLTITSTDGKVVHEQNIKNTNKLNLDLTLEKGIYLIQLSNSERNSVKRFIVN